MLELESDIRFMLRWCCTDKFSYQLDKCLLKLGSKVKSTSKSLLLLESLEIESFRVINQRNHVKHLKQKSKQKIKKSTQNKC